MAAIDYLKKCQLTAADVDFIYFYHAFVTPSVLIFKTDFLEKKQVEREKSEMIFNQKKSRIG
ncbi:MAG: hypothetical protein HC817_00315 [Saprospiraceae bacterium]|nr:hypothetical protein [Saprospiraceae bacterium]